MTAITRVAATTSSDMAAASYPASNIMDVNPGSLIATQSAMSAAQYVSVQVAAGSTISYVALYNRGDTYASWVSPYEVWLGNSAGEKAYQCGGAQSADTSLGVGPFLTWCGGLTTYSYVSIVINAGTTRFLAIGEVEIYRI